ncbi:MAG: serine/threonine-protein kinase [Sandaracinus sp.]
MGGRFRIGRELGAGGMGTVHEAIDLAIDRPVALKLLQRGLAADEHQVARFEREARAAAKLSHPNVIGVTELVRDEALGLGLVMELLHGESLASRLTRGALSEADAVAIFMQALDGLAAAHDAGMVHRDLKPSNVFLVPIAHGVLVKLLDFGIVKLAEEGAVPKLTRKGTLIGTPTYMSPEQVACDPVDARSDVYSMGACLYEALTARAPYVAPHTLALIAAVGGGPPVDLHDLDRSLSPDLVHIVRVAMSRDPNGRYQNARAMRAALANAVLGAPPSAPTTASRAPTTGERTLAASAAPVSTAPATAGEALPTGRRTPVIAFFVVLGLLAALALTWNAMRGVGGAGGATGVAPSAVPVTTRAPAPPPTTTPVPAPPPEPTRTAAVGVDPPPPTPVAPPPTASAAPRPHPIERPHPSTAPPSTGPSRPRVGEQIMDPFASP